MVQSFVSKQTKQTLRKKNDSRIESVRKSQYIHCSVVFKTSQVSEENKTKQKTQNNVYCVNGNINFLLKIQIILKKLVLVIFGNFSEWTEEPQENTRKHFHIQNEIILLAAYKLFYVDIISLLVVAAFVVVSLVAVVATVT